MARLALISNRLPVRVTSASGGMTIEPTVGGLTSGLWPSHVEGTGRWIGWPGDLSRLDADERRRADERLRALRLVPVPLSSSEIQRYYDGYANGTLWPALHYLPGRMTYDARDWDTYVTVNARFADAAAAVLAPADNVWVQDYHLMLVPRLLRARRPDVRIGFFLHVPFPGSEVFRVVPHGAELLEGVLGSDLVGFQTFADHQSFLSSVIRVLGLEPDLDEVEVGARRVRVGVFPIGPDFDAFENSPAVERAAERRVTRVRTILGVDRLDYTKGIPERLRAFEQLLVRHPRLRERVRLLQYVVPSRDTVPAYRELRAAVDELAGRINGDWGTAGWVPIHIVRRPLQADALARQYRSADVMLVTPLRDGMNLVAKEFVASRTDHRGVLVLSALAGAAAELNEATIVNPYDATEVADAIERALGMPPEEQERRMVAMRARVRSGDARSWATRFLAMLAATAPTTTSRPVEGAFLDTIVADLASAERLVLLLDYDGTLTPIVARPELAAPDPALCTLLLGLGSLAETAVHVVSGRPAEVLQAWLGELPIHLHAEHGGLTRDAEGAWPADSDPLAAWRRPVEAAMEAFTGRVPGSFVETKRLSLAWHYRLADLAYGAVAARELRHYLRTLLANAPLEVLRGRKVVEVRSSTATKASVARAVTRPGDVVLAMGDDRTDDDLFAALPAEAITISVGAFSARARFSVSDVATARALLAALLVARRAHLAARPGPLPTPPA